MELTKQESRKPSEVRENRKKQVLNMQGLEAGMGGELSILQKWI